MVKKCSWQHKLLFHIVFCLSSNEEKDKALPLRPCIMKFRPSPAKKKQRLVGMQGQLVLTNPEAQKVAVEHRSPIGPSCYAGIQEGPVKSLGKMLATLQSIKSKLCLMLPIARQVFSALRVNHSLHDCWRQCIETSNEGFWKNLNSLWTMHASLSSMDPNPQVFLGLPSFYNASFCICIFSDMKDMK